MVLSHQTLDNDTVLNVAQLLKEQVGQARTLSVSLSRLRLDDDLTATELQAELKLTRIAEGLLVEGTIAGRAELECVRCLEPFLADFGGQVEGRYQPSIDVRGGFPLEEPEDDDVLIIDGNHQLDLTEFLRQVSIVTLPFRPVCGDDCPGFTAEHGDADDGVDHRLAALEQLLDEDEPRSS